jgi:hypothetical protein
MKKSILVNGMATGALLSIMFVATNYFIEQKSNPSLASTIGNILLMASLSMVFFAIRNVRDKVNKGYIGFNTAFRTALMVILIGTFCYTTTKSTYAFIVDKEYLNRAIDRTIEAETKNIMNSKDVSDLEKKKKIQEFTSNMNDLRTPYAFVITSILEFFPMGLIISILCAALMKRSTPPNMKETASTEI